MAKPEDGMKTLLANLVAKTGKTLDEWTAIAKKSGLAKHGEIVKWLKGEHELTHGYANQIALSATRAADAPAAGSAELVDAQYAGGKAALRPLCDALIAAAKKLGKDVEVAPKKTSVSLRRAKQFALIQAASATRIDLGLQLKGVPVGGRLEKYPSTMCTHRVRLESKAQLDGELLGWMKQAYDAAG